MLMMAVSQSATLSIGIAGLGAIGGTVARRLADGIPGLRLLGVAVRDAEKARHFLEAHGITAEIMPLDQLAQRCDVIVECLPPAQFAAIATATVAAGKIFVPLSVGRLLEHPELMERARTTGARILVPTGALLGLDAVRAAAESEIRSVKMVTRKPPGGLEGAPYLMERGISLKGLKEPQKVFDGSARD